ncbi:MAG: hypothetical protein ACK52W_00405, partial [Alphaproteobacteria bacterium]
PDSQSPTTGPFLRWSRFGMLLACVAVHKTNGAAIASTDIQNGWWKTLVHYTKYGLGNRTHT